MATKAATPTSAVTPLTSKPRATAVAPTSPAATSTRTAARKSATCTNLGTGKHYACTQAEYDQEQVADEPMVAGPTKDQCKHKLAGANFASCNAAGFTWGMTEEEMAQADVGATCATGTQLYWGTHTCYIVKNAGNSLTYNDGSVRKL